MSTPMELTAFPPLTRPEAYRAMRRIYHRFGGMAGKIDKAELMESRTSRGWVSRTPTVGCDAGLGLLIRDTAWAIFHRAWILDPADTISANQRLRERAINRLREREHLTATIMQYAIEMGWLSGALRKTPPAAITIEARKLEISEKLKRWRSKAKRAATAIKKLERTMRRLTAQEAPNV
jgi:hypothetical protein